MADAQLAEDDIIEDKDPLAVSDTELENLRKELEAAKIREADAVREAQEYRKRGTEVTSRLNVETNNRLSAEEIAIANGIAASTAEAERLEAEVVQAQENGKFSEAAKLTRQLASAQMKIDQWLNSKTQFENRKEQLKNAPKEELDPAEATFGNTVYVKQWAKKNPRYFSDTKFKVKADSAHYDAIDAGLSFDTPEYIQYIDNKIAGRKTENDSDSGAASAQTSRVNNTKTVASAPVSRGSGTMSSGTSKSGETNRLTAVEAEYASISFPNLPAAEAQKKYLEGKQRMIKENRNFLPLGGNA